MAARPVVLPEPFDGQSSWGDWKLHFEDVAAVNTWSAEQKLQWLRVRLTGRAQKAFHRLPAESQASYDAATRALQERFEPKSRMTRYQAEFESRSKKRTEGWADFAEDLRSLVDKAFPDLKPEARERFALQSYLKQLDHPQVAFSVRQRRPATLDDAVTATLEMKSYVSSPRSGVQSVSSGPGSEDVTVEVTTPVATASTDTTARLTELMEKLTERVQTLELQATPTTREGTPRPPASGRRPRRGSTPIICWSCGQPGHIARTCRRPTQQGNELPPVQRAAHRRV